MSTVRAEAIVQRSLCDRGRWQQCRYAAGLTSQTPEGLGPWGADCGLAQGTQFKLPGGALTPAPLSHCLFV